MASHTESLSVTVATSVASSTTIPYESYEYGGVIIPNGSSITTLTWFVWDPVNEEWEAAEDASSNAVTSTVAANQAHPIPAALQYATKLRCTGNAAGTIIAVLKGSR